MKNNEEIKINSFCGKEVSSRLEVFQSKTLVVLLAGGGYKLIAPYLFYSHNIAAELELDVLSIEYFYDQYNLDFDFNHFDSLVKDCQLTIDAAIKGKSYSNIVFIGKSLGTVIATQLLEKYSDYNIYNIFLTPLRKTVDKIPQYKSLVIFGGQDKHFSLDDIKWKGETDKVEVLYHKGANHSLNTSNYLESQEILIKSSKSIYRFLNEVKIKGKK